MVLFEYAVAFLVAWYLNIIVHEGGHLIFGLLCGYRFCSFRIGSLMIVRQNGKINFRSYKLAGTGGQCLMIPPEKPESSNKIILFNLGGIILNFFLGLIAVVLKSFLPDIYILSTALSFTGIIAIVTILTNGIPLNVGGIANDGMNALHLSKNPDAADAFRKALFINAAQTEGVRISNMPEAWFTLSETADMQNVHCASLAVFAAGRTLDGGDTLAAEQQIIALLNSDFNIIGLHRSLLTCDLICCRLLNDPSADISRYMTPQLSKIMQAMKTYPSVMRTEYIIALLSERREKKAEKILLDYNKNTKNFPYRQDIESELCLMSKALEIFKNHL